MKKMDKFIAKTLWKLIVGIWACAMIILMAFASNSVALMFANNLGAHIGVCLIMMAALIFPVMFITFKVREAFYWVITINDRKRLHAKVEEAKKAGKKKPAFIFYKEGRLV